MMNVLRVNLHSWFFKRSTNDCGACDYRFEASNLKFFKKDFMEALTQYISLIFLISKSPVSKYDPPDDQTGSFKSVLLLIQHLLSLLPLCASFWGSIHIMKLCTSLPWFIGNESYSAVTIRELWVLPQLPPSQ